MDTNSFVKNIKTEDFRKGIVNSLEKRFDTLNYEIERTLPISKKKKVIGLMKDELDGKIMKEFVELRPKAFTCLINDGSGDKKAKGTKKFIIRRQRPKCKNYRKFLENNIIILRSE